MSKFLSTAAVLTLFLLTLFSCRNETFFSETQNSKREEEFFRNAIEKTNKYEFGEKLINALKQRNKKTHFISKMSDQKGIPIWEHLIQFKPKLNHENKTFVKSDTDSASTIIIPLSGNNSNLSSLLFVKFESENNIQLNNITNSELKIWVNNNNVDVNFREGILMTFLYVDQNIFGIEKFTNIPHDLFIGLKYGNNLQRIEIGHFEVNNYVPNVPFEKVTFVQVCGYIWKCKNHEEFVNCDKCTDCYSYSCKSIPIFIDGDDSPHTGGGGSNGNGGGGGSSTPSDEPCTLEPETFYRLAPGCDDGNEPIDINPCENLALENTTLKALTKKPLFQNRFTEISTNISTNTVEKAFSFGVSASVSTNETVTPVNIGDEKNVDIHASYPGMNIYGAVHTHPRKNADYKSFSFKDLFTFSEGNKANSKFKHFLIKAYDGSVYSLSITNQAVFTAFFKNHLESYYLTPENTHDISTDMGKDITNVIRVFMNKGKSKDQAYELALAYVMNKHNMGMAISKMDTNGNFIPIFVNELTPDPKKPKRKSYEQTEDCNL